VIGVGGWLGYEIGLTHPLPADNICEPSKKYLANQVSDRSGYLDTQGLVGAELVAWWE
jgi:hypothetical protein